jgi:lycopene cyclase domain-containing protein
MAMLAFTVAGSFWLEIALKVRVLRRIRRAMMAIAPVAACFLLWDAYAIANKHWFFDKEQIIGVFGPLNIPLEEYLFFIIIPLAAIMTIEAVRAVKKHWIIGDEK